MSKVSRLEVVQTGARRRWTLAEKQRIVAESEGAPRAVSATGRSYGMSPSHLFGWRRLAREGRLQADDETTHFARAVVAHEAREPVTVPGRIEIVLASGTRVIVDRNVEVDALMRVISAVKSRWTRALRFAWRERRNLR